jgi:hypothetical protein
MVENIRPRPSAWALARNAALLLCLLAPSAWMIATIPPLWRDVDAHTQLTQDPRISTFWGHGPAYCYVAKIPLFLGERWERSRGFVVANPKSELSTLTDTGIWLLIIAQHLALSGAGLYFIVAITQSFWVRLALSLVWASNALFYTFAHCVGSESLSLILLVFLVGKALRLIRSRREPRWIDWYVFAIGLFLCLFSRHANRLLILLLPAVFVLSWAQNVITSWVASAKEEKHRRRRLRSRHWRQAVIAIAVGIACFGVANSLTHRLARKTKFHPHSRIGFTFLWRLHFLKTLPPETRAALLEKVADRAHTTEARQLVRLLGRIHDEGGDPTASVVMQRAIPLLFPSEKVVPWEKLDLALNQMAWAFLLPPTREHLLVTKTACVAALRMSMTEIVDNIFETTGYFFEHKEEMRGCAHLVTFRDSSAEKIARLPAEHAYFYLWRGLTYNQAALIWTGSLLVLVFVARQKKIRVGPVCAFGISLAAIGLLMAALTCLLVEFLPRYGLPMWQMLLLSFYIFAGLTADLATRGLSRSA